MKMRSVCLLLFTMFCCVPLTYAQTSPLAFPTAEGYGKNSQGGRGGRVIEVTNLNPNGPGSFREAIEASGPRTVVFRTGGTIDCSTQSAYWIQNPYLTIAGQTAPGDGILLKGCTLVINTHNVIVRYMRIRLGDTFTTLPDETGALAIVYEQSHDVIIDHVSLSWGSDDTLNMWEFNNVTVQWSIIAEGIHCGRKPACQGKGMLVGYRSPLKLSIHHNLFANTADRNPYLQTGTIDVINNVHHNVGSSSIHLHAYYAPLQANIVGNYYSKGPATQPWPPIRLLGQESSRKLPGSLAYIKGNIDPIHRPTDSLPELDAVTFTNGPPHWPIATDRIPTMTYPSETDALQAYEAVLSNAGDSQRLSEAGSFSERRGSVDARIINDVRTNGPDGTGTHNGMVFYSQNEVGGFPVLSDGPPYADTDHDGMADVWENQHGLNMADPADGNQDSNGNGYTNLEEFLNGMTP